MDKTAEIEKLKKEFNKSLHIIRGQFTVMTLIVEHLMNMLSANGAGKV